MTKLFALPPYNWPVARYAKVLCLLLSMGVFNSAHAQGTAAPVYEMLVGPGSMDPATKPVLSTLLNSFPGSQIEFLKEPAHLLITPPDALNAGQVGAALEVAGMRLVLLRDTTTEPAAILAEAFPVYPNTGDPDVDAATYDAEKARWIDHNPEAYERFILSAPCDTP